MSRREIMLQALRDGKAKIAFPKDNKDSFAWEAGLMEIRHEDGRTYRLPACDIPNDIHQKIVEELGGSV